MDLPKHEVPLEPEQRRSHSPPGPSKSRLQEDQSPILTMTSEKDRRDDVPASDAGHQPAQYESDDDESESEYQSIFALRVPSMIRVSTGHYQPEVSDVQKPLHSSMSKTLPATALTVCGAEAAAESRSSVALRGSRGSDFDESDTMSDITSCTESSLVETFQALTTPLTPQLLSVLICMKEKIDNRITSRLQSVVAHPQGTRQCPAGPSSGFGSSASGFLPGDWSSVHGLGGYGGSRQQPARGGDGHDSEADDGDDDDRNKQSVLDLGDRSKGRLACVFFKRYPNSEKLSGACLGPGWDSVHRLKEHIYRVHQQTGSPCPRCREVFETSRHLNRHLQQNIPCKLSASLDEEEILFINYEQEQKLRKRVRNVAAEERWVGIFQVVFPDVPENQIPSPYHEAVTTLPSCDLTTLHNFQRHLLQELLSRISRSVDSSIERSVPEVCHRAIREVFAEFMSTLQFTSHNPNGTRTLEATPMVESQPRGSSEVLSPRDMGFSPSFSSSSTSTPSAQLASHTFEVDSESAQNSYVTDHWLTCKDLHCINGDPLAHAQPWQTPGAAGKHTDEVVGMMNTSERSTHDESQVVSSSFWSQGGWSRGH
ncbi:hypothetical protein MFIFM68171_06574 [Madurella fahalii]|uniref:C2H2-type domain-containing protein n=1 Tax=Madurella fahalii TaxID=1157608 RepID=A0ABQ0GFB1_9PEZI